MLSVLPVPAHSFASAQKQLERMVPRLLALEPQISQTPSTPSFAGYILRGLDSAKGTFLRKYLYVLTMLLYIVYKI